MWIGLPQAVFEFKPGKHWDRKFKADCYEHVGYSVLLEIIKGGLVQKRLLREYGVFYVCLKIGDKLYKTGISSLILPCYELWNVVAVCHFVMLSCCGAVRLTHFNFRQSDHLINDRVRFILRIQQYHIIYYSIVYFLKWMSQIYWKVCYLLNFAFFDSTRDSVSISIFLSTSCQAVLYVSRLISQIRILTKSAYTMSERWGYHLRKRRNS